MRNATNTCPKENGGKSGSSPDDFSDVPF